MSSPEFLCLYCGRKFDQPLGWGQPKDPKCPDCGEDYMLKQYDISKDNGDIFGYGYKAPDYKRGSKK